MTHETVEVPLIRDGVEAGTCSVRVPRERMPRWMEVALPDGRTVRGEGAVPIFATAQNPFVFLT